MVGLIKKAGITMNAKEKAIEACGAMPIARHIDEDRFTVGWYTDRLYETGVGSKVDDEGLFFWADTGYGDCDHPRWEWESRPYSRGLMHAFHQGLAAVLSEGIPVQEDDFYSLESEFQTISQLLGRITINGQALFNIAGGTYGTLVSVRGAHLAFCWDAFTNAHNGLTVRWYGNADKGYLQELTGHLNDDMYDLLVGIFDVIDAQVLSMVA